MMEHIEFTFILTYTDEAPYPSLCAPCRSIDLGYLACLSSYGLVDSQPPYIG